MPNRGGVAACFGLFWALNTKRSKSHESLLCCRGRTCYWCSRDGLATSHRRSGTPKPRRVLPTYPPAWPSAVPPSGTRHEPSVKKNAPGFRQRGGGAGAGRLTGSVRHSRPRRACPRGKSGFARSLETHVWLRGFHSTGCQIGLCVPLEPPACPPMHDRAVPSRGGPVTRRCAVPELREGTLCFVEP